MFPAIALADYPAMELYFTLPGLTAAVDFETF